MRGAEKRAEAAFPAGAHQDKVIQTACPNLMHLMQLPTTL